MSTAPAGMLDAANIIATTLAERVRRPAFKTRMIRPVSRLWFACRPPTVRLSFAWQFKPFPGSPARRETARFRPILDLGEAR
jgi:hypothetical protein